MKTSFKSIHALRGLIVSGSLALFTTTPSAHADLFVNADGVPNSGVSTWTFSGSYTVFTGETLLADSVSTLVPTLWSGVGDLFRSYPLPGSVPNGYYDFTLGGNAQLVGSLSGVLAIDGIFVSHGGGNLDNWGFGSNSVHTYQAGETLTFSGTAVLPIDILAFGGDVWTLPTHLIDTQNGATVHLSAGAVPEPSSALLLAGSGMLLALRRRRLAAQ